MFAKTVFALSAAIVLAASSAALAMTKSSDHRTGARAAVAQSVSSHPLSRNGASSDAVFAEGKLVGRDPDASVRLQLRRDYPLGRY